MGRFSAVAQGAAFFMIAMASSPLAHACEGCEPGRVATLDVTSAVDSAISLVVATWRKLQPTYDVLIVEADEPSTPPTVAQYAAAYDASDGQRSVELPGFRRRYEWQLTYRDDAAENVSQSSRGQRLPVADVKLDDSWVFGLRFELDYGWKR